MDSPKTPGGSSVPLAAHSAVKSHWKEEFIPSFNSLTSSFNSLTIKMAEEQIFIRWCKLFTLRCLPVKNFFRLLNDYGCKYGCKSCCGCLYYSCLRMVVFVIAHCLASMCIIFHHIGLQLQGLSFPHQLLFKNVVLKTSDTIYYFRVKNGWDYQNGWVENCFTWTDWVTDTITSWDAHHS